mgnify:FL=1
MLTMSATEVRKDWSRVLDSVTRRRPAFIKRTHDNVVLASTESLSAMLSYVRYETTIFQEDDGSITLSLDALDLVVNEKSLESAKKSLANDIEEYAEEYYANYESYSVSPNRRAHLPYVMKALIADSPKELEDAIEYHVGKN